MRRIPVRPAAIISLVGLFVFALASQSFAADRTRPRTAAPPPALQQGGPGRAMPLSSAALDSKFGRLNQPPPAIGGVAPAPNRNFPGSVNAFEGGEGLTGSGQANSDYNNRPQNEPSIAIKPGTAGYGAYWIAGANDYGIGNPVGGGYYTSSGITYFPPFPLISFQQGSSVFNEVPIGTGDPAIVYSRTRSAPGVSAGQPVAYYASLAFSNLFCQNGIQVQRTLNDGQTWNRAITPLNAPPNGVGFPFYHNGGLGGADCSVFWDKEYIAADNTGGPNNGRVYVTATRFLSDTTGVPYFESPIYISWSDDNGLTWSPGVEISGFSLALCPNQTTGPIGECDESQGSYPTVLPDGRVAVQFINGNGSGFSVFRSQLLMVIFDPATQQVTGPYKIADLFDGLNDFPIQNGGQGRQTLCNSNFRIFTGSSNITAVRVGAQTILYSTTWDNKKQQDQFPFPTLVGAPGAGYPCPTGKKTDADCYVYKSTNLGVTWTDVTPPGCKAANDQWFPWVAADNSNRVCVVYHDRVDDPANKLTHTKVSQSNDGGVTWTTQNVSLFASNMDNAFANGTFIGDYLNAEIDILGFCHTVFPAVVPGKGNSDIFKGTTPSGPLRR